MSKIPLRAQYHAAKAANIPKYPPAFTSLVFGAPSVLSRYAMANIKNARSRTKKRKKNATVDLRVAIKMRKVKMNHP